MSQAYAGSGTTAGNRQGSSTYKAYRKNLEEKSAGGSNPSHCPESLFCSVDITANFYKAINVFFFPLSSKRRLSSEWSFTIHRNTLLVVAQGCSGICTQGWIPCWKLCPQLLWIYKIKGRVVSYTCVLIGSNFSLLITHRASHYFLIIGTCWFTGTERLKWGLHKT